MNTETLSSENNFSQGCCKQMLYFAQSLCNKISKAKLAFSYEKCFLFPICWNETFKLYFNLKKDKNRATEEKDATLCTLVCFDVFCCGPQPMVAVVLNFCIRRNKHHERMLKKISVFLAGFRARAILYSIAISWYLKKWL